MSYYKYVWTLLIEINIKAQTKAILVFISKTS